MTISGSLIFLLFIFMPNAAATWIAAMLRRPLPAFVLGWLLTPILTLLVELALLDVLRTLIPPSDDGTGTIMLPFFGIATGLLAGSISAIIVTTRAKTAIANQSEFKTN